MLFEQFRKIEHRKLFSDLRSSTPNAQYFDIVDRVTFPDNILVFAIDDSYAQFLLNTEYLYHFVTNLKKYKFDFRIHNHNIEMSQNPEISHSEFCKMYNLPQVVDNGMLHYIPEDIYMYTVIDPVLMQMNKMCDNFSELMNQANIYDVLIVKTPSTLYSGNTLQLLTS